MGWESYAHQLSPLLAKSCTSTTFTDNRNKHNAEIQLKSSYLLLIELDGNTNMGMKSSILLLCYTTRSTILLSNLTRNRCISDIFSRNVSITIITAKHNARVSSQNLENLHLITHTSKIRNLNI